MKGTCIILLGLVGVLVPAGAGVSAAPPGREAVVQALIDRSRFLEDTQFQVPLPLYRRYLHETVPGYREPAPVTYILDGARYHFALSPVGDVALTVRLRLLVLDPTKCRNLPILSDRLAWKDIKVNNQPVTPATSWGWLRFTPTEPGEHVITAETSMKRATFLKKQSTLHVPRSVRTLLSVDSPGAWEIIPEDDPRRIRGDAAGGTHGEIGFTPRDTLRFTFHTPEVIGERAAKFQLRGDVAWNLDAGTSQLAATLDVAILGGETDRVVLEVPADAERVSVTGPDVRETRAAAGSVEVFLRGRITGKTRLTVNFERPRSRGGRERLEGFTIRDGRWAGGTLVVTNTAGGAEVLASAMSGLREKALADIPASTSSILAGAPALAYDITSPAWSAEVDLLDLGSFALTESIADLAHYELSLRPDGTMMTKATYEVRNRHRQFLRLTLPEGARVLIARVNEKSRPVTPVPGAKGTWLLPLIRSKASVEGLVSFPVEVVFLCSTPAPRGAQVAELPLPRIDIPIAYAWCEGYVPEGMGVIKWSGPLRKVDRFSSETATTSLEYGSSQLAEGYTRRIKVAETPPPPTPKAPPAPVPPTPTTPEPARPTSKKSKEAPEDKPPGVPGYGELHMATFSKLPAGVEQSSYAVARLAKNYYRAGKDFYEANDFSNARFNFENVVMYAPKSIEAGNAARFLGNIKLAEGKLKLASKAQKAAGAQVMGELKQERERLEGEQRKLIEEGLAEVRAGRSSAARAKLESAETLSAGILAQGANKAEQDAQLGETRKALARIRSTQLEKAQEIQKDVKRLEQAGKYHEAIRKQSEITRLDPRFGKLAKQNIAVLTVKATQQRAEEDTKKLREIVTVTNGARGYDPDVSTVQVMIPEGTVLKQLQAKRQDILGVMARDQRERTDRYRESDEFSRTLKARLAETDRQIAVRMHIEQRLTDQLRAEEPGSPDWIAAPAKGPTGRGRAHGAGDRLPVRAFAHVTKGGAVDRGATALATLQLGNGGVSYGWRPDGTPQTGRWVLAGGGGGGGPMSAGGGYVFVPDAKTPSPEKPEAEVRALDATKSMTDGAWTYGYRRDGTTYYRIPAGQSGGVKVDVKEELEDLKAALYRDRREVTHMLVPRARHGDTATDTITRGMLLGKSISLTPADGHVRWGDKLEDQEKKLAPRDKELLDDMIRSAREQAKSIRRDMAPTRGDKPKAWSRGKDAMDVAAKRPAPVPEKRIAVGVFGGAPTEDVRIQLEEQGIRTKLSDGLIFLRGWDFRRAEGKFLAAQLQVKHGTFPDAFKQKWLGEIQKYLDLNARARADHEKRLKEIRVMDAATELDDHLRRTIERQNLIKQRLVDQWQTYYEREQYDDALLVLERARELDPEDATLTAKLRQTMAKKDLGNAYYPLNGWRELSDRRDTRLQRVRAGESPGDRKVNNQLDETIVSFTFNQQPVADAIAYLQALGNVNIVLDRSKLRDPNQKITLKLNNVPIRTAIKLLTEQIGLQYGTRDGVVLISDGRGVSAPPVTEVYDVRDLLRNVPSFSGATFELQDIGKATKDSGGLFGDDDGDGVVGERSNEKSLTDLQGLIRQIIQPGTWDGKEGRVVRGRPAQGSIIITHTPKTQQKVADLLEALRRTRGPQVQMGKRLTEQEALGVLKVDAPVELENDISGFDDFTNGVSQIRLGLYSDGVRDTSTGVVYDLTRLMQPNEELQHFIRDNYSWRWAARVGAAGAPENTYVNLARKLATNREQKVHVSSLNLDATSGQANGLGINFTNGRNGLAYAVIDEAQFRTLKEFSDANADGDVDPNLRVQDAIVGTDALIANGMIANNDYAADNWNRFSLLDNPIRLPHERYVLIDNGRYLTAMRAGAMEHWTQKSAPVFFASGPQRIDVPRVGRLVRFEKTLVKPEDDLVIRANCYWKGGAQ